MSDPTRELTKMMGSALAAKSGIDRIRARLRDRIPGAQSDLFKQIQEMRQQLQEVGIGKDKELEDRYLQALYDVRSLHQSYAMREGLPNEPIAADTTSELGKAVQLGELLLSVYGSGNLVKGATGDLEVAALRLIDLGEHTLSRKLLDLAKRSQFAI